MSGPEKVELDLRELLAVRGFTVQIAPDELAARVLPPSGRHHKVFLLLAQGLRLNSTQDVIGMVAAAPNLGFLAGLMEARIAEAGGKPLLAQYVAQKDQAGSVARQVPAESRVLPEPGLTQQEIVLRMLAEVEQRREVVVDLVATIRKATAVGERDAALWDAFSQMFTRLQEDPRWQATLSVAALLMLAEELS